MTARPPSRSRAAALVLGLSLAAACHAPAPAPAPPPRPDQRPAPPAGEAAAPAGPARWAIFDRLGVVFDEAGHGATLPGPEPLLVDGVRLVASAGVVVAQARHADHFLGFRSLPARLGGGFLLWSEDRTYRAADFLGEPAAIADLGATGGARPWLSSVLLRTPSGLFDLDPRALTIHRAAMPGVADALALDARRGVRLDALGRASFTVDAGATWTDVLATRGALVRSLGEGPAGEVVLTTDTPIRLALGAAGGLGPLIEPPAPLATPEELRPAAPLLTTVRPTSSRGIPGEILAQAVTSGALLPGGAGGAGGRALVAREGGVRVFATGTALPLADVDLPGIDTRFSRCQAATVGEGGSQQAALACVADTGAALIDLDGSLARPALEATFRAGGGGFFGGPRGRLAYDGACGPQPPTSLDLGGPPPKVELNDEGNPANPPEPEPAANPDLPPEDDARACVRASTARWVERRLRGDDARRLYRWVPGDDGTVTALVLTGPPGAGDGGAPGSDGGTGGVPAAPPATPEAPSEGVQVIRVDPADPALGGGAFPAVPPPQKEAPHRAIDVDFWRDDDGAVRGWVLLPAEGEEKLTPAPSAQGPAHRLLPVVARRGGRVAGVRIDPAGHLTVYALPKGTTEVVTGGRFALAMAHEEPDADGGAPPKAAHTWFESVDGGASWAPIEGPPVGALEPPSDDNALFACSPIGCAWASGVIRLGWGGPHPAPVPELTLTAATSPRVRPPEPPALTCHLDGSATAAPAPPAVKTPPKAPPIRAPLVPRRPPPPRPTQGPKPAPPRPGHGGRSPPSAPPPRPSRPSAPTGPAGPIALRLAPSTLGTLLESTWTGEVLPPFQPAAGLRHLSANDRTLHGNQGSLVPVLGAGARGPVDLLLLVDKHRLRAGAGPASFQPFDVSGRFTVAADGPEGSLAVFDGDRASLWLTHGDAVASALHLVRAPDVTRLRLTLARRLAGGGLAVAGYSTGTAEILAGDLDLGRAVVGPLAAIGRLEALSEAGTCPKATHRLLVELPVRLRIARGGALFDQQVTVSAVIDAGPDRVCLEALEAALPAGDTKLGTPAQGPAVIRATLGAGGSASLWSAAGTVRGACTIDGR